MRLQTLAGALALATGITVILPTLADAQLGDLKKSAERAVTQEASQQIERLLREAIRCALDDPVCPQEAEEEGKDAIFVDENGEAVTDDEGVPITDQEAARERAGVGTGDGAGEGAVAPGEGVWANYDFVPGEEILFYDDYSGDRVGDFPRRMNFVRGNWEVVEWEGRRFLRNTGRSGRAVEVPLPRELPDRFTIEFDAHLTHGNHDLIVATGSPTADGGDSRDLALNHFRLGRGGAGVAAGQRSAVESLTRDERLREEVVPVRIMVDRRYAKMYLGSERVANIPNAELERSGTLYIESRGGNQSPIYIGPIRVAAGGRDLYDDLLDDGRAVTRGILFTVNSDRIRPESTPTLKAIGSMLSQHPDLRLRVEGHTDSDGDQAHNQDLSERRATSVKAYLVDRHGIDGSRLETAGHGESRPVADNVSAEGKQKNRRVELVRLEG